MKSARQEILDKLKSAVKNPPEKPDFDSPIYHSVDNPLVETFKNNLENVNGSVYVFSTEQLLFEKLASFLSTYKPKDICCIEDELQSNLKKNKIEFTEKISKLIEVGITGCEYLIAHTGSVMVSSAQKGSRQIFIYPPVHIVIASKKQMVNYLDSAYSKIQEKYEDNLPSQITLITGPSRTADIEKTLILGAHGPRELHVFLLNK